MTKEIRNSNERNIRNRTWFDSRDSILIRHFGGLVRFSLFLLPLCGLVAVIGCAKDKNRKWLGLLFDGVLSTVVVTNASRIEYDENGKPLDKMVAAQPSQRPAAKPKFV